MVKNNSNFFKVSDKVRILPRRDEWRYQVPYEGYFWAQDWLEPVYEENDVDVDIDMDAFMAVVCH